MQVGSPRESVQYEELPIDVGAKRKRCLVTEDIVSTFGSLVEQSSRGPWKDRIDSASVSVAISSVVDIEFHVLRSRDPLGQPKLKVLRNFIQFHFEVVCLRQRRHETEASLTSAVMIFSGHPNLVHPAFLRRIREGPKLYHDSVATSRVKVPLVRSAINAVDVSILDFKFPVGKIICAEKCLA